LATVLTSLNKFANSEVELRRVGGVNASVGSRDPSKYSSLIVFSLIPIEFVQAGNSAIQSADDKNPTVEPNTE